VPRGGLAKGDKVQVVIPPYAGLLSAGVIFVLPVALAVCGMLVGSQLGEGSGARDMGTIAGGVVGFALAGFIAIAVNRVMARNYEIRRIAPGS
jgi:positive regulator of sigma E activity